MKKKKKTRYEAVDEFFGSVGLKAVADLYQKVTYAADELCWMKKVRAN